MRRLFTMDLGDYPPYLPEIVRKAVRGVILRGGRLLMVRNCYGEVGFPGGGVEGNETDLDTLVREVREETGYHVLMGSVRPFGEVEEKRLSLYEDRIWHQFSRYYFCWVDDYPEPCRYTRAEQRRGMHAVWIPLDDAIAINADMLRHEGAWNQRSYQVLLALRDTLEGRSPMRWA